MDDPVVSFPERLTLSDKDMESIMRAMSVLSEKMSKLGDAVEETNDIVYTTSRGGRAYVVDTAAVEQEAEDDLDFLRDTQP